MLEIREETVTDTAEWIPAEEARSRLGISKGKMSRLLADNVLPHKKDEVDGRFKLVKAEDVERLRRERVRAKRRNAS
jgi:hypothetical protein